MAKIRNPQEFFEVFKSNVPKEKPDPSPAPAPKVEPDRGAPEGGKPTVQAGPAVGGFASGPKMIVPPKAKKNTEVFVTPGRITVTLSHTSLMLIAAFVAGIAVFSFCLGARYSKKSDYIPRKTGAGDAVAVMTEGSEPSLDKLPAHDMSPAAGGKPSEQSAPASSSASKLPVQKAGYWLQLVSGISKEKADTLAKSLSVNWETEVVKTGKSYGVRIGSWDSAEDVNARRALAHFKPQKDYKGCYFIKVETR